MRQEHGRVRDGGGTSQPLMEKLRRYAQLSCQIHADGLSTSGSFGRRRNSLESWDTGATVPAGLPYSSIVLKFALVSCSSVNLSNLCGLCRQSLWLRRRWPLCPQLPQIASGLTTDASVVSSDAFVVPDVDARRAGLCGQSLWLRRECPLCPQLLHVIIMCSSFSLVLF